VASAGNEALGACEVALPIEGEPPSAALRVALKPGYLSAALGAIDADLVELHIGPEPHCLVWLCAAGEARDGSIVVPMLV
jgi:hypothetical protein